METVIAVRDLRKTFKPKGRKGLEVKALEGISFSLEAGRTLARHAVTNVRFRLRGSTDDATERIKGEISEFVAGRHRREFERLGPYVLAGVLPRLYPQVLDIAWGHQDAGRKV